MALCLTKDCTCQGFTQSASTGFTRRDCSTCKHAREYHWSRVQPLAKLAKNAPNANPETMATVIRGLVKQPTIVSSYFGFRKTQKAAQDSFLMVLPKELVILVCQYIVLSEAAEATHIFIPEGNAILFS
jgi:hypothetical protein